MCAYNVIRTFKRLIKKDVMLANPFENQRKSLNIA